MSDAVNSYLLEKEILDYLPSWDENEKEGGEVAPYDAAVSLTASEFRVSVNYVTAVAEANGLYADKDLVAARDKKWDELKGAFERGNKLCEECNENPGELMVEPFIQEVYGRTVYVVYCKDCRDDAANEV